MDNVNLSLTVNEVIQSDELKELLGRGGDSDTGEDGTGEDGTGEDGTGEDGTGEDGIGEDGTGNGENTVGLIVNFNHDGDLPAQSSVRIYVGNQEGLEPGDKIYLYYYDPATGKLATLPYSSSYVVDEDGYITIDILHCSAYVVLPEEADSSIVISLKEQITVSPMSKTLYTGGSKDSKAEIIIELPNTLELVENLSDRTSGSAVGAVTVSYRSSNNKVASVDKNGIISAVSAGLARIYAKFTLYSGKTKTVTIPVTVKKPELIITKSTVEMQVGDTFTFEARAVGLTGRIEWATTKDSIVVINNKTGKAKAKSQGTDYVTVRIGSMVKTVKVIVINRNVYSGGDD